MPPLRDRLRDARRGYALETLALFAALTLTLALAGWLLAGVLGIVLALGAALLSARLLASMDTARAMRLAGAVPLSRWQAPAMVRAIAELTRRAGLDRPPALYLMPSRVPNAFAAGTGEDGAIAVSRGLVDGLDDRELAGVLAHEMSHLQAGDTVVMRFAGALVQTTRSVGQVGLVVCIVAAFMGEVVPLVVPLAFFAAPSIGLALQLWLSRRREFAADATAVALTGDAYGLASALCRLDHWRSRLRYLGYALGTPPSWLGTHPPTVERLGRLQALQPEAFLPRPPRRAVWHWAL